MSDKYIQWYGSGTGGAYYHAAFWSLAFDPKFALALAKKIYPKYKLRVRYIPANRFPISYRKENSKYYVEGLTKLNANNKGATIYIKRSLRMYVCNSTVSKRRNLSANKWASFFHELAHIKFPNHSNKWRKYSKKLILDFVRKYFVLDNE